MSRMVQRDAIGVSIVSQLSKCLKFMTFREGCFKTCGSIQVLK